MNERVVPDETRPDGPATVAPLPDRDAASVPPRPRRRRYLALLVILVVLAAGVAAWRMLSAKAPVTYTTAAVTRGDISRAAIATGTVNPRLTVIVGTYVSGVITKLGCDYNTVVKKGQLCAKIDPRPYQSVVNEDQANLEVAQAQLKKDEAALTYARLTYNNDVRLLPTNAVAQNAVDSARSTYAQAQAQISLDKATIAQRKAQLDAAQVNLGYTDIVSPVNGIVVSRSVTVGQTVAASFQTPTLFLIASDLTKMEVDVNVSESDVGGVKVGDKATFTVDAYPKRVFKGVVSQVRQSPQTVQNVVTYDVVVDVENSDLALMPGMTAATRIEVAGRKDVVRVPDAALRFSPPGQAGKAKGKASRVWVLRDRKPVPVKVATGLDDETNTEIVSGGIRPGDRVITGERSGTGGRRRALRLRL